MCIESFCPAMTSLSIYHRTEPHNVHWVVLSGDDIIEHLSQNGTTQCTLSRFVRRWHHWAFITERNHIMYSLIPAVSDLNSNCQLPRPGDRRNYDNQQDLPTMSQKWRKAYRNNTTNWMGRQWSLKLKVISILILTEIFPTVHQNVIEKAVYWFYKYTSGPRWSRDPRFAGSYPAVPLRSMEFFRT
jgi:hypothetical protein